MRNSSAEAQRLFVIVPAYNEARSLKKVISGIQAVLPDAEIIIVNDGSTDGTGEIAKSCDVKVIHHPKNLGKGAALMTGFKVALENGASWIATLDADGQHDPRFLGGLLAPVISKKADLAIGSRMSNLSNMPAHRILSNKISSMLVSWRAGGVRIEDSQCGFRVISSTLLREINLTYNGFQAESELLIRAGMQGFKIISKPISTIYKDRNYSSIRNFHDTIEFILLILQSIFWRF